MTQEMSRKLSSLLEFAGSKHFAVRDGLIGVPSRADDSRINWYRDVSVPKTSLTSGSAIWCLTNQSGYGSGVTFHKLS